MEDKVIVIFVNGKIHMELDVEIPLNITANELIYGLNEAFKLGISIDDPEECFLRMENPIGIIRGDTIISEYGIRNGSKIIMDR